MAKAASSRAYQVIEVGNHHDLVVALNALDAGIEVVHIDRIEGYGDHRSVWIAILKRAG